MGHVNPQATVPGTRVGAGDGVIDAQDEAYAQLRVWRDANQDGISQPGELKTLAESGVASIRLASQSVGIDYGDARLVQDGLFTRADGSQGQAGSFVLAQNAQERGCRRKPRPVKCIRRMRKSVTMRLAEHSESHSG